MGSFPQCLAHILWALEFASNCGSQGLTYSTPRQSAHASVYEHVTVTVFVTGGSNVVLLLSHLLSHWILWTQASPDAVAGYQVPQ